MLCAGEGWGRRSARGCGAVEPLQQVFPGSEPQNLGPVDVYRVTGLGIATHAGLADLAGEVSELPQLNPMALRQMIGDLVQDRIESRLHHVPGQMRMRLEKLLQQFRADHLASSFVLLGHERASLMLRLAVLTFSPTMRSGHCS